MNRRPLSLIALAAALPLGACAAIMGDQAALYDRLTDRDVALAADNFQQSLETAPDGTARSWQNPETGHRGAITPTHTYLSASGQFCRDYRESLIIGEQSGDFSHTACRDDQAGWVWL
ncbi:MAG: RT0821/Lpp0805 family surface protein [Alphaproteobacteria bacterium]